MFRKVKQMREWIFKTTKDDITAAILFYLLIIVVIVDIIIMLLKPESTLFLSITTFALVLVTGLYGWHTRQIVGLTKIQAETSEKALKIALNSNMNGHAPVVKTIAEVLPSGDIKVIIKNVGPGPALNLRYWIQHKELPHLSSDANKSKNAVIGPGEEGNHIWSSNLRLPDFHSG